jgi:hypothetical protein
MFLLYEVMAGLACCIAIGFYYRIACLLFGVCWTYVFLLDKTFFQNHFYLICLLSFLFLLTPANRLWSMDTWGKPVSRYIPRWSLLVFKLQFFIVYFFGGIAKLNPDWLSGHPVSEWMTMKADPSTLLGTILGQHWFHQVVIWGGLGLDLSAGFFLMWHKTYWLGFLMTLPFHLLNSQLFKIGIFPWLMLTTNGVFAPPDWPRRVYNMVPGLPKLIAQILGRKESGGGAATATGGSLPEPLPPVSSWTPPFSKAVLSVLGVYFVVQFLVPLRCFLYPDNVNWTEEGHRFSWRMMLRDKQIALVQFHVTDPQTGETSLVPLQNLISPDQLRMMSWEPDMVLQMAHYLADNFQKAYGVRPIVTADVVASLDFRPFQPMIDTTVDLASQPETMLHKKWIVPLRDPGRLYSTVLSEGKTPTLQ